MSDKIVFINVPVPEDIHKKFKLLALKRGFTYKGLLIKMMEKEVTEDKKFGLRRQDEW